MVVLIFDLRLRSANLRVDQSDICDIVQALTITTSAMHNWISRPVTMNKVGSGRGAFRFVREN